MAQSLSSAVDDNPLSNSAARADLIRDAVRWIAERKAEVKALNAEINEYQQKHIKGDLGFKLADFNAVYRVSQLEVEDRDQLLECVREGFAALGIGGSVDWVAAAAATPRRTDEPAAPRPRNGAAPSDETARAAGRQDGLGAVRDHAARYPEGEPGHADYMLGWVQGQSERVMALGNGSAGDAIHEMHGGDAPTPRRRGRPRKQQEPEDAGAEA